MKRTIFALNCSIWNAFFHFSGLYIDYKYNFSTPGLCNILFPFNKYTEDSPLDLCLLILFPKCLALYKVNFG